MSMNNNRLNTQIISIFAIIIAVFVASSVIFSYLNTNSIKQSVETETSLSSVILTSAIQRDLSKNPILEEDITSSSPDGADSASQLLNKGFWEELTQLISRANDEVGENIDIWVVDASCSVVYESVMEGGKKLDELVSNEQLKDLQNPAAVSKKGDGQSALLWIGGRGRFMLNQQLLLVRPVYEDKLYLVMCNRGVSIQASQRRYFTLFAGIEIILMISMIVVLANTLFSYRKRLILLATTDELTGLSNRKSFNETYKDYINNTVTQNMGKFTVFLIDIDFFKQINDTYGHAAGDLALRTLAGYIGRMAESCGGFAGRWGGDEFIGVLPVRQEEADRAIRGLCEDMRAEPMDGNFRITLSIGAVEAERSESPELAHLTELADLALYFSKENGRDQYTFYSKDLEQEAQAQQIEKETAKVKSGAAASSQKADEKTEAALQGNIQEGRFTSKRSTFADRLKIFIQQKLLKSILLGVKWMAPFVAGGGLLIGLAFLFDACSVNLASLTVAERTHLGSITPLAASLKSIGDSTFNFMLPVFAGFMAYGLAGESAFLPGFVGGFMTIQSNSGFIGAMIAGLIAGLIASENNEFIGRMPRFIQKIAPIIIFPIFNLLLMYVIAQLVITPLSTAMGTVLSGTLKTLYSLDNNIAGAVAGGMMAFDMGGIVNKVAYNYGVYSLTFGGTGLMASVMAGGMVPPIGIALSMVMFKNKYSAEERDRTASTLFMGLSFITEGALPFVFSDVARVIPSCIAGSTLAGLLSSLYGCELPAPHGGIFVIPVMTHPILYLIALAAGAFLTALILGFLKKRVKDQAEKPTADNK